MSSPPPMSFQRIAYEALEVCNGVELATLEAAVARTGLGEGATAIDIGTGNATVAIHLTRRFGLTIAAIELDPLMADLAGGRIDAAGVGEGGRLGEILHQVEKSVAGGDEFPVLDQGNGGVEVALAEIGLLKVGAAFTGDVAIHHELGLGELFPVKVGARDPADADQHR